MRCKLKFQFDDYKGTAVVDLPKPMSLKELKVGPNLSDYMEHATDQHNLSIGVLILTRVECIT